MTDTMTSQNIDLTSWGILYNPEPWAPSEGSGQLGIHLPHDFGEKSKLKNELNIRNICIKDCRTFSKILSFCP
jgi:hypothetical protein